MIQTAQEKLLLKARQEFYDKCADILKCEPTINIEIEDVPIKTIEYIAENKDLEFNRTPYGGAYYNREDEDSMFCTVRLYTNSGKTTASSYDSDFLPF